MEGTKMPIFATVAKSDSNPGSLDCESGILPLSYRAPHWLIINLWFFGFTSVIPITRQLFIFTRSLNSINSFIRLSALVYIQFNWLCAYLTCVLLFIVPCFLFLSFVFLPTRPRGASFWLFFVPMVGLRPCTGFPPSNASFVLASSNNLFSSSLSVFC